ncbi:MAG: DNA internalization-related competence protein ComEC/Rec2 [Pseudomonadota bacterium]
MNRPVLFLLSAFVTGLAISPHLKIRPGCLAAPAVGLILLLLFLSYHRKSIEKPGLKRINSLLFWLLFVNIGLVYALPFSLEKNQPRELLRLADGSPVRLSGVLEKMPVYTGTKTELLVKIEQYFAPDGFIRPLDGHIVLFIKGKQGAALLPGNRLLWMCGLRPVSNYRNPGAFDFERQMALKEVYATGWVSDPALVCVIGHIDPGFSGFVENARIELVNFFDRRLAPVPASLYKALIVGDDSGIPKEVYEVFTRTGVNHVLSISGLHMAIVAMLIYALVLWLTKRFPYLLLRFNAFKIAAVCSIPLLFFYGAISGLSSPSVRALIMTLVFLVAVILNRQWDIYNNLAIAMWFILLLSPGALYSPSFQLSFAAAFSIVLLYPHWYEWVRQKTARPFADLRPRPFPLVDKLLRMVLVSVAATIGTAPIVAYHFFRLSLIGPLANVIVVPLVGTAALFLGLISAALMPFSESLAGAALQPGGLILDLGVAVTRFLSRFPLSSVWVPRPYLFEILLFYAGILIITFSGGKRVLKWLGPACLCAILFVEVFLAYERNSSGTLEVTCLDVGQGNSALVELPGGKTMIIDGGGSPKSEFDVGERVVAPFLRTRRIHRLDYVVLTHPHPDHVGGLVFLLNNFDVKSVWMNGDTCRDEIFAGWQDALSGKSIRQHTFRDGSFAFDIDGVRVDIFGPGEGSQLSGKSRDMLNHRSLVIRIEYGARSFLFPGDIDNAREDQLLEAAPGLRSDILLAPHHGSSTSSSENFIDAVSPEFVVFSVGARNRFHFPRTDVVERYAERGVKILRTDTDGAITAKTNGEDLVVKTFRAE